MRRPYDTSSSPGPRPKNYVTNSAPAYNYLNTKGCSKETGGYMDMTALAIGSASLGTTVAICAFFWKMLDSRFASMDFRFTSLESRFTSLDSRFTSMESRIGGVESRLGGVESRLDGVESRLDGVERKLDKLADDHRELSRELSEVKGAIGGAT